MKQSLILQLPDIVAQGHLQASHFLAGLETRQQRELRSRQLALSGLCEAEAPLPDNPRRNHLVCGDDLGVLAALLCGLANLPQLRGRVNLICFDPCVSDPAASATVHTEAERLAGLTMRLLLMRALLADTGFICLRLTHEPTPCARLVVDTVFGTENNAQDILWHTPPTQRMASAALRHGRVHVYSKHRRRVEPVLPDPTAPWGQSATPAEAMLRHLLAVCTAPGDIVVTFNAAEEIAAVASRSARQWIITTSDGPACDALHRRLTAQSVRPFLRHALPAMR